MAGWAQSHRLRCCAEGAKYNFPSKILFSSVVVCDFVSVPDALICLRSVGNSRACIDGPCRLDKLLSVRVCAQHTLQFSKWGLMARVPEAGWFDWHRGALLVLLAPPKLTRDWYVANLGYSEVIMMNCVDYWNTVPFCTHPIPPQIMNTICESSLLLFCF